MESTVLVDPQVRQELDRFIRVELHVDGPNDKPNSDLETGRFREATQPLYVILTSDGVEVEGGRLSGYTRSRNEYLGWLKQAYEKAQAR